MGIIIMAAMWYFDASWTNILLVLIFFTISYSIDARKRS